LRNFLSLRRKLARASKAPDLVFFACIYDCEFFHYPAVQALLPWPWSGLYLHSFGFRKTTSPLYAWHRKWACPEKFARSARFLALATLDEGIRQPVEALAGAGKYVLFPDITDSSPAEEGENTLAGKLRRFADGRPVITLCGMLFPQRGVELFLETALANPQWCFALIGEIPYFADEKSGRALLEEFLRTHPCGFFHGHKVLGEQAYNGVVAASDVIWNVHIDWPGSSNTLTKAALFEKPVLVADKHLLAERVREFRLGEVCRDDSAQSVSEALGRLLSPVTEWRAAAQPRWREYCERHSPERLREAFGEILAKLPQG
jgi:hypothetical protein